MTFSKANISDRFTLSEGYFLDLGSFQISVPGSLKSAYWALQMKRKWQISDISQLNLLPFRDKNDEEKGTGLDFIFEPRNDPSS